MTASSIALTARMGTNTQVVDVESQLIRRAASGDEAAFEQLYHRHVARVHTLASRMASRDTADDLTQDIFIRAWDKLATFKSQSTFSTWLHRLAVNVILGKRRGERSDRYWVVEDDVALGQLAGRETPAGLRLDLEAAIAQLPDGSREIFVLYDVEGWTHEEIAERLGLAIGTSKSQLSRARATLRRLLHEH